MNAKRMRDPAPSTKPTVRIVAVPPGEAPLWVRQAWVGLELPLPPMAKSARRLRVAGVLTGPKSLLDALLAYISGRYRQAQGFVVPVLAALDVLATASPEAAAWWRTQAPHLCKPWRCFVFPVDVCKPMQ